MLVFGGVIFVFLVDDVHYYVSLSEKYCGETGMDRNTH